MVFHCGEPFVLGWLDEDDINIEGGKVSSVNLQEMRPARPLQEELTRELEARLDKLGVRMQWQAGDFLLTDNLGLVHYASPGTQADWKQVGLRILHRTTIVGGPETVPTKSNGRKSFTLQSSL